MSVLKNNVFRVISFFLMISCMIAESFTVASANGNSMGKQYNSYNQEVFLSPDGVGESDCVSVLEIYAESGVNEPPVPTPAPTGR